MRNNKEPEIKEEGAPNPADSFNPQEYDITSVQEDNGQSDTTNKLNEADEVDTVQKNRSTKEMDELGEGDVIE